MALAQTNINSEEDFLKVGPDAVATFDNSLSKSTEYASSANLRAFKPEDDDDLEDEDLDEDDDEDEEDDDEDEEEEEIDDEEEDDEEAEEDDHNLAKAPRAPSVYRKL